MSKKVTYKNLKSNIGKKIRTSKGSLIWLSANDCSPTVVWLEMKEGDHGWKVTHDFDFKGAERFLEKETRAYYIVDTKDFKEVFGDEPAYYVDEEPIIKKIFANTLSTEEIIERLQNGEELKSDRRTVKLIKGMLCGIEKESVQINAGATIDEVDDYYFECVTYEEPFKITEVGLYKTRDGRKVFISFIHDTCAYNCIGLVEGNNNTAHWKDDGKFFTRGPCEMDIVSKWEE